MKDRIDALKVALDNELKERDFYRSQAARTSNSLGRAMFEQIAAEEDEHYQRILALHKTWSEGGTWPETVPLQVGDTKLPATLKNFLAQAKAAAAGDADDLAALREAIAFEEHGASFYARLRDQVTDPREQAFFNLLAKIEEEHYRSLKETLEFLSDPASWFRMKERGGLDGA